MRVHRYYQMFLERDWGGQLKEEAFTHILLCHYHLLSNGRARLTVMIIRSYMARQSGFRIVSEILVQCKMLDAEGYGHWFNIVLHTSSSLVPCPSAQTSPFNSKRTHFSEAIMYHISLLWHK